jgi:TRAP-type C4-dicarboxylate transport system permease small subunit
MDFLFALNGRVTLWLARIAAGMLAALAVLTFCDVVARYIFAQALTFTVEATEFGMALIVFLAVGRVTHDSGHIAVDFVTLRLSEPARAILAVVTNLLALAFLTIMVWRLWLQAVFLYSKGDQTQVWGAPYWPIALVVAGGSMFLLTGILLHLIDAFRHASGRPPSETPSVARPFSE